MPRPVGAPMRAAAMAHVLAASCCHGSTLLRRLEAIEGQIGLLRALVSDLYCSNKDPDFTTKTGAWCIKQAGEYAGRPIGELHFMDEGLGPLLSKWLAGKSVLDLGAGSGQYGTKFELDNSAIKWVGLDGAVNVEEFTSGRVKWADLAAPIYREDLSDWVMSLEVGEHIPQSFEHIFIENLHHHNMCGIILSWAVPNQAGHGHVNNQPNEYIIKTLDGLGYDFNETVAKIGRNASVLPWFQNTFMVFNRRTAAANTTHCALKV